MVDYLFSSLPHSGHSGAAGVIGQFISPSVCAFVCVCVGGGGVGGAGLIEVKQHKGQLKLLAGSGGSCACCFERRAVLGEGLIDVEVGRYVCGRK